MEIGPLATSIVVDTSNIQRQTVEDLAERWKRVAALVKQHRENKKEQKKKEREEAKAANKGCGSSHQACPNPCHLAPAEIGPGRCIR